MKKIQKENHQENHRKKRLIKILLVLFFVIFFCVAGLYFIKSIIGSKPKVVAKNSVKQSIRLLFLGDMMFDRYIREVQEKKGGDFIFFGVKKLLSDSDLTIGNLEGPITNNQSRSVDTELSSKDNLVFTFDPKFAQILAGENIKVVNIGNNHIYNFGESGLESTKKYLTESGIKFFGDPEDENTRMILDNIKGTNIAFINFNQFVSNGEQKTLADISKAKNAKADLIIVYAHWGTEFAAEPSDKIKNLAHEFVDSGSDLIIGSHPHVVQSKEEYKNKTIYYSLGNFVFDQYFNSNTQKGLAVMAEINTDGEMQFNDFYVKMKNNGQTIQE